MKENNNLSYYAIVALVTTCIMQLVFTGMIYNPLSLYTSSILEEMNLTRTSYALTLTTMSAVCALANLTLGWFKKKINLRGILIMGGVIMTASMFIYSKATSLAVIYVAAILAGIAFAYLASAVGGTIINAWYAKHSGLLVGFTITLAALGGTVFSPMIGGWIKEFGWRQSFLIAAIISAVTTAIIGIFFRSEPAAVGQKPAFYEEKSENSIDSSSEAGTVKGLTLKEGVKTIAFWSTALVWLLIGIIVYSIMGIISVYVQDLGFDALVAGKAIAPMFTANMILPFILGWLSDRIPVKYVVAGGLLLFTIACIILVNQPTSLTLVYIVAVCTGFGIATGRSTLPMQVKQVFGNKEYASFIGIFVGIFSGGIALGSTVIAAFHDATGTYASAMKVYIPLMAVVIFAMLFLSDKTGQKQLSKSLTKHKSK